MTFSSDFIAFIISLLLAASLTPLARRLAIVANIMDKPGERRVHIAPVPLLGGLAIFAAFILTVIFMINPDKKIIGILLGGFTILVVGVIDDAFELSPKLKLIGQLLAAMILVAYDVRVEFVTNPFGPGMIYLGFWGLPITLLWVVALTNVVNFIDGLDGLAAGVSSIAAAVMAIVGALKGQMETSLLSAALAGSALGFLRYNFNPARVFMGDTGAMFLGFTLAAISALGAVKGATTIALTIPSLALGVPIIDTALAKIRRLRSGIPVYVADKGHLHHRLLDRGMTQKQAVLAIYAVSIVLGLSAIIASEISNILASGLIITVCLILLIMARRSGVVDFSFIGRQDKTNISRGA